MNSDKIADLYSAGDISGYAYLACIDREIYTVEDAVNKGVFGESSPAWAKEIESFVDKPEQITPQLSDHWNEVRTFYYKLEEYVDVRTRSALTTLQEEYSDFKRYFLLLLQNDSELWTKFRALRSIGETSYRRARLFVSSLLKELELRGIPLRTLYASVDEDTESNTVRLDEEEEIIRGVFQSEMENLSVRSSHALELFLKECGNSYHSFYRILTSKGFNAIKLRNIGYKSISEIMRFITRFHNRVEDVLYLRKASIKDKEEKQSISQELESNTGLNSEGAQENEFYNHLFEAKIRDLSTRSFNAITTLYSKCGNSVSNFFEYVSRPDFQVSSLPSVGKKSANEISLWIKDIHRLFYIDCQLDSLQKSATIMHYANIGLKGDVSIIEDVSSSLGYFALFSAINQYIEQLPDRERSIVKTQLSIYTEQESKNRKESAKLLGITPERVRQIRKAQFKKLSLYVRWLEQFKRDFSFCLYKRCDVPDINQNEKTSFNENFILWVISIVWPKEYQLFGDVETAFQNPYGYEANLVLLPFKLTTVFDFDRYIKHFDDLSSSKRVDDMTISVRESVMPFFKNRIYYELIDEVEKECRYIVAKLYGFKIANDTITIERNSFRTNPEWVELIIRETGRPLTIEEIFEVLEKKCPGKSKSAAALAGAVKMNPNIVPIGRSSTYGLKEWTTGEHRGGTIREFATEYLLSLQLPVAQLEDIGRYVRQYRSYSSDKSILSNLLMTENGSFSLFYDKDNNRCVGLSNYDYGEAYRRYDPVKDARRDFKTSCTLLEQFVAEKGHLPFHNHADVEEMRLCRFWYIQLSKYQKGQLLDEESQIISSMIERLSKFQIRKSDYQWLNNYNLAWQFLSNGTEMDALPEDLKTWLLKQKRAFDYGRMPEERANKYKELIDLIINNAKRI